MLATWTPPPVPLLPSEASASQQRVSIALQKSTLQKLVQEHQELLQPLLVRWNDAHPLARNKAQTNWSRRMGFLRHELHKWTIYDQALSPP